MLNVRKLWVRFFQVGIPFSLDESLVGSLPSWLTFTITRVQLIYNIHAFDDLTERRKPLLVQESIAIGSSVEKYLSSPRIWSSCGKDHRAPRIADLDRIIRDALGSPLALNLGVTIDAKLCDKARKHAKYTCFVEELFFRELLQRETKEQ